MDFALGPGPAAAKHERVAEMPGAGLLEDSGVCPESVGEEAGGKAGSLEFLSAGKRLLLTP